MKKLITLIFLLNVSLLLSAQKEGLDAIRKENLQSYMTFFASDEMQGREAGTQANDAAALYIMTNLIRLGVKPIPQTGSYFQEVPMQRTGTDNRISVNYDGVSYKTDSLLLFAPPVKSMETTAPVVFAGFGHIDEKAGYNDIRDIDMKNKIVIVMTGTPESVKNGNDKAEVFGSSEEQKLSRLLLKGARTILMVYNPSSDFSDPYRSGLVSMMGTGSVGLEGRPVQGIPLQAGFITRETADILLKPSGRTLRDLQDEILYSGKSLSFEVPGEKNVTIVTNPVRESFKSRNVIGIIGGTDPVLKDECIIYTAHFDHTGVSGGEVFNGADDNASGSMALLEIAGAFMNLRKKPQRTIIFAWVNAEEKGLLGSRYYTENPVFPLEKTLLNINLDMVGRSKLESDTGKVFGADLSVTGPRELELYSGHESAELDNMINESALQAGIKLIDKGSDLEWGGSDHMSFRNKGVTAIMFHSGIHADLHKLSDDLDKIDFDKMERSAKLCFLLGYKVAVRKERFTTGKAEQAQ